MAQLHEQWSWTSSNHQQHRLELIQGWEQNYPSLEHTVTIFGAAPCLLDSLLLLCLCSAASSHHENIWMVWAIPPSCFTERDFSLTPQKQSKEQDTDLDLHACTHTSSSASPQLCCWHWSDIVIFSHWTIYVTKGSLCWERLLMGATVCQSLVLIPLLITQRG